MPANQSLAVRDTCKLETAIREIDVSAGSVVLTRLDGDGRVETTVVEAQDGPKTFDPPQSGFDVFAPDGARFHVVYETDPVGTEEARDQGPKKRRSSEERQKPKPRRKRSTSRSSTAKTKTSSAKSASKKSTRKKG